MDDDEFREAMSDVAPLMRKQRRNQRVTPADSQRKEATAAQLDRREAALGNTSRIYHSRGSVDPNPLTLGDVPRLEPTDVLAWKKDGVQHEVFQRLKNGKYSIEGSLDLHRLNVKQARAEVFRFFNLARAKGWRTLLIAHGRGEKSATPARLKSYVAVWLSQIPDVIALHSADQRHGGTGAVLVMLKKSMQAKEEARESYGLKTDARSDSDRC